MKKQLIELTETIISGVEYAVSKRENPSVTQNMLMDCYEGIVSLGERLKNNTSKNQVEEYTKLIENIKEKLELLNEAIFNKAEYEKIYEDSVNDIKVVKSLIEAENIKLEVLFLPYKASMWDSLESVWLAAKEDERCDTYVMPIPYFDRNVDGSLGAMHYEGDKFPDYVPVIDWKSYKIEKRMPDVVYVHNPYDGYNLVTCVHPDYFSDNLKKYVETLIYIPYFSTAGGMGESQAMLPSYNNFDYIIVQTEKFRKLFDKSIPEEKLLPLGSPKFDRVINMCKNPPEAPEEWKEKIAGKKVYFFNTSISGLLQNTRVFLNKMKYVFEVFDDREDSVLIWRPHPLLESTLESMRPQFLEYYQKLKKYFILEKLGILDETPDITKTIALCDAYIGDEGTSVTSLFGIVGKPIFVLNNWIDREPEDKDILGQVMNFWLDSLDYVITHENQLLSNVKEKEDKIYYEYLANVSEYSQIGYYIGAKKINNKIYLCPGHAQDIGIIENGNLTKIPLERLSERGYNFSNMYVYGKYIVLIPWWYPALVRYDMESNKIDYFSENVSVFSTKVDGENTVGGVCQRGNYLFLASPIDNLVLVFDILTGKEQILTTGSKKQDGCIGIYDDGIDLWLMPTKGRNFVRWNPNTGEKKEYTANNLEFSGINPLNEIQQDKNLFKTAAATKDFIIFAPWWADTFIKIDKNTGEISEWETPFNISYAPHKGYHFVLGHAAFFNNSVNSEVELVSYDDRALYRVNLVTNEYKKVEIDLDIDMLKNKARGFTKKSEWLQYVCIENEFNSLKDFIQDNIIGEKFSEEKQLKYYEKIAANSDGTCGEKVNNRIIEQKIKN